MTEVHAASVTIARTLTAGGTVFQIGTAHPVDGYRVLSAATAEGELRALARAGDSVVVVGDFSDRDRILRRCPAWGVASVWVGDDARPEPGLAAVTLLVPETATVLAAIASAATALTGDVVALTPAIVDCTDEVCITCSDEGRLGEVVAPAVGFAPALVRTADGEEEVDVTIVGDVEPLDLILIHAGSAIARIPEAVSTGSSR